MCQRRSGEDVYITRVTLHDWQRVSFTSRHLKYTNPSAFLFHNSSIDSKTLQPYSTLLIVATLCPGNYLLIIDSE